MLVWLPSIHGCMRLTQAMPVSRWASTILMFMSVLLNWSALCGAWQADSSNSFPLISDFPKILQLYSMLFPVHTFLRLSQATHTPKAVACVFQLIFLLSQTLNTKEPLQIFNPALVAPSRDMTDPASYSENPVYVEHECLDPMVQQCRRLLRETLEDRFHRQQGYAVKRVRLTATSTTSSNWRSRGAGCWT